MNWQTTTSLLPHQQPAVDKLIRSRVAGLFMDMGTGKTRTAIEFARLRQAKIDRLIWYCPVSLKDTIHHEIQKHTDSGDAAICLFDEFTNPRTVSRNAFWYIVGLESMSASDRVVLTTHELTTENTFVVVDESSYIKGHAAKRTQRLIAIGERARYRMILTGTPISQGVVDLYAQMRFLSPQILGYRSFYSFAANHLEYSDKFPGLIVRAHHTGHLAAEMQPYIYQVTKEECLDLPKKIFDERRYAMTAAQRDLYDQAKREILLDTDPADFDSYIIFRLFTALQQIVCGYWNRRDPETGEQTLLEVRHERLDMLDAVLNDIPEAAKVIIWCKHLYAVRQIVASLTARFGQGTAAEYHGDNQHQRDAELARFRARAVPSAARFFVATQATGGHGLTLNEAHYVIFYENEFNYSHRLQAEDRCHRIGQTMPVTYVDIVCRNSIDDRIMRALASKGNAVADFKRKIDAVRAQKGGGLEALVSDL